MTILGIDPGFARVGIGIVKVEKGVCRYVMHACIETHKTTPFPQRLVEIREALDAYLEQYKPERLVMEKLYFKQSVTTAMDVAQARGVILVTCAARGLSLVELMPSQVKAGLTGYGGADKKQMQMMVKMQLNLKEIPKPDDAADALALAICGSSYR